jgi:hypothetical protein
MRSTKFALAALAASSLLFSAACSNSEGEPSFVSEARADVTNAKDFGWRATPNFSAGQNDQVHEFH